MSHLSDTVLPIDLHCHSYCSDGTFSPEGLVIAAKKAGLYALALTDHDTIDGLALFHEAGKTHDLETISGIELAAFTELPRPAELHIVGLGFDPHSPIISSVMETIKQSRHTRNLEMLEALKRCGAPLSYAQVEAQAGGQIITRAHFANALVKHGYAATKDEAFMRYIGNGSPAYVKRKFLTPEFCIQSIVSSGGIAVLAHPTLYGMQAQEIFALCKERLIPAGLKAIECRYSTYTSKQQKSVERICDTLGLLPSGGSDFHGTNKPDILLGKGRGNLLVPYSFWEDMKRSLVR